MCDRLQLLDVHPALLIFKSSLSHCRFSYLLRTSKTFLLPDTLMRVVDRIFRDTLEAITNNKLDEFSWDQASLPLVFGGLGIRKVEDLALPAYLLSVYSSADLSDQILRKFSISVLDDVSLRLVDDFPLEFIPDNDTLKREQRNWE